MLSLNEIFPVIVEKQLRISAQHMNLCSINTTSKHIVTNIGDVKKEMFDFVEASCHEVRMK
ncbi:CLUMA_CG020577, isoform A [Clunio marinus]|uniref:CLUMA_CG020577, isoform A n=1 Tax=Clunio marinus TaxID=568069 RepID=A0A1J1J755_9DIPT|nr:CLUMA_CG020577, isoform A [Clunio marinus]